MQRRGLPVVLRVAVELYAMRCIVGTMLIAALLALSVQADELEGDMRARELIGMPVAGADGEPLGTISGLMLDVRDAGVHYIVLGSASGEDRRFAYRLDVFRRGGRGLTLEGGLERRAPLPGLEGRDYVRAAELLGRGVEDRIGNTVGRLQDVVVNLYSGRSRQFLVVFFDQPGSPLALPAWLVRLQAKGNPVLHAEPNRRT
jgi:sporulation protein YlmC with PRC-barrel domain